MIKRILGGLLLLFSAILFPYTITLILGVFFVTYFKWYVEVILVAIFMDMVFAPNGFGIYSSTNTTIFFIILFFVEYLKTRIRFYDAKYF